MTQKLFYCDSHLFEFDAAVTSCFSHGDKFAVILDKTAFFPEGGGQPGDTGSIGNVNVTDTREIDGKILHIVTSPISVGENVHCILDRDLRFRRMQSHSGEHMVSGVIHKLYGYNNAGFHMGDNCVTLDTDGVLAESDIRRIERVVNEAIRQDIPIKCWFPSDEELKSIEYRSKLELTENVRIVQIGGYDTCACCAMHVNRTGEIGLVKILDFMSHRGGTRMTMVAGIDAYNDCVSKYDNNTAISRMLSAKPDHTADAVKRVMDEQETLKSEITRLKKELVNLKTESFKPVDGNRCIFEDGIDSISLRSLVNAAVPITSGICAAFSGNDDSGYNYIMGSTSCDLRAMAKEINTALSGRGGGSSQMIQGSVKCAKADILKYFN